MASKKGPAAPLALAHAPSLGFLLAQVALHSARGFSERIESLELTAPEAVLLRMIGFGPGIGQKSLAGYAGQSPSRMVALIDGLETKGLVERRRSQDDRRNHELHLTRQGAQTFERIAKLSAEHEENFFTALSEAERARLKALCSKIVEQQGLGPGFPAPREL